MMRLLRNRALHQRNQRSLQPPSPQAPPIQMINHRLHHQKKNNHLPHRSHPKNNQRVLRRVLVRSKVKKVRRLRRALWMLRSLVTLKKARLLMPVTRSLIRRAILGVRRCETISKSPMFTKTISKSNVMSSWRIKKL